MILAIAALLLHAPAVPQSLLSNVPRAATIEVVDATRSANGQPVADASTAAVEPAAAATVTVPTNSATQPAYVVALQPGRLTPEPITSTNPTAAANAPALFSSSAAAAAFITSTPAAVRSREQEERRKRLWLGLSIAQSSAASFDAWSTRRVISNGGQEMNPMLRPFAGNASLYAAIQVAPLLLDYLGRHMMDSQRGWERHTWWVPQSVGTAMSVFSGVHNLGVQ